MNFKRLLQLLGEWLVIGVFIGAIVWMIISAVSCTPQRRLERLMNRHPYLAQKDTFVYRDTVRHVFNGVYKDTILRLEHSRLDTVVIRDKQLTMRTFIHRDSIFISGSCDTLRDTTYIEKHVPYDKFVFRKPRDALIRWDWLLIVGFICTTVLTIYLVGKFKK